MSKLVEVNCPSCKVGMKIPYILIGALVKCDSCAAPVVPDVPVGTVYPETGYEITFKDFHQLLTDEAYIKPVMELLRKWYDLKVEYDPKADAIRKVSRGQTPVNLLDLHKEIQGDDAKRKALYQTAMSLWR